MDSDLLPPQSFAGPETSLALTVGQARFLSWTADLLIYVVVINLFVQFAPFVIVESFAISLLTAVFLKLLLDAILGLKKNVLGWFGRRQGARWRIGAAIAVWAIMFFSKFVIIEATHLVFGDRVILGDFFQIVVLILALMITRQALSLIYSRVLGQGTSDR